MRILSRYILKEVLVHTALGTALFTFVLFMGKVGQILELVVRESAPLPSVAELVFLALPTALKFSIPMGLLVGILIGLSRLAADSEVTAMRASGIGAGIFVRTIGLLALVAFALSLLNSLLIAPRSSAALAELENRLKTTQASYEVQPRVFYEDFPKLVLYVEDVLPGAGNALWKKIFIADISDPSAPIVTLAQEGVVVSDSPNALHMHLQNGYTHETQPKDPDHYSITTFQNTDIPIAVSKSSNQTYTGVPLLAELSTRKLIEARAQAADNPTLDPAARTWYAAQWRWYSTELHGRFALPAACLLLALVGIPLGLSARKGGKATGFVLTIFVVLIYYFATLGGLSLARLDKVPPAVGVWTGNFLFLLAGVPLLWQANRRPLELAFHGWQAALRRLMHRPARPELAARGKARRRFGAGFPQILDEYILRDFLMYLSLVLATLILLTLVFNFFEILSDIVRNRVPFLTVIQYLLTLAPSWAYTTAPLSVLLAVLITFGLMEKSNEVTAMKAGGISVYRVAFPVLALAAGLAVALFFFDQYYLPGLNKQQEALRNTIKGKPAQTFLRPDRMWIFGKNSTVYYYEFFDADRNTFGNLSVFEFDPASFTLRKRVFAAQARWDDDLKLFVFEQGWERTFSGPAMGNFRRFDVSTFAELIETPAYFKKEIRQSSEMNTTELSRYIAEMQQSGFDVERLKVQLQKKFAFPAITLVMAVLAVPYSLRAGRRGALTGVAVALGIFLVYWMTAGLFEAMGNLNQLPPALAAWSPDLLFGLAGGYLILKVPT